MSPTRRRLEFMVGIAFIAMLAGTHLGGWAAVSVVLLGLTLLPQIR